MQDYKGVMAERAGESRDEGLQGSEQRLRALINATSYSVYRMSPDWREMRQLDGRGFLVDTPAPSTTWLDTYIAVSDRPHVWKAIEEAIRDKRLFELEHRVLRADGSIGWTFSRATPILNAAGEIVEWFGAASDVTARKEAEQRQGYLVRLGDALRDAEDPIEVQMVASQVLGEHLGVSRVAYGEVADDDVHMNYERNYVAEGTPLVTGRFRMGDFGKTLLAALQQGRILVVPDIANATELTVEERTGYAGLGIHALVGIPLVKRGRFVANLAVHNGRRRAWTKHEVSLIEETAERTWAAVERARAATALRASEERFRLLVENVKEYALVQIDRDGNVMSWNPGAERLFGYSTAEMQGQAASQLLTPEDRKTGVFEEALERVLSGQRDLDARWLVRKDGTQFWAQWVTEPVRDALGQVLGAAVVLRDETERRRADEALRRSLADKEALLKEVHHRVKNNLQVITSLVNLQAGQVDDARVLALFDDTRNRVYSIAAIHELLYRSESFASINLADYGRQLGRLLVRFYGAEKRVRVEVEGGEATLELERSAPYGLLLNELISNACKHAFPDARIGVVSVRIEQAGNEITLSVADNGVGLKQGVDPRQTPTLGMKLIDMLASQLGGRAEVTTGTGVRVEVKFPVSGVGGGEDE